MIKNFWFGYLKPSMKHREQLNIGNSFYVVIRETKVSLVIIQTDKSMANNIIDEIRRIIKAIVDNEFTSNNLSGTYIAQRKLISSVFNNQEAYGIDTIIKRLVFLDSLYSTNASYSYFSIGEMAQQIWFRLGTEQDACDYYYDIAKGGKDIKNIFNQSYGIQKNLSDGPKQMSLLSKYAYYTLLQHPNTYPLGFPIYDSLVNEIYPKTYTNLGLQLSCKNSSHGQKSIEDHVKSIEIIRDKIFGKNNGLIFNYQQFDLLDAYLWRMGKFENGNLSLLLCRNDYESFIKKLKLQSLPKEKMIDYRKRLTSTYAKQSNISKIYKRKKYFIFNQAIRYECIKRNRPFAGLSNEKYLNKLLTHWKTHICTKQRIP